MSFPRACNKLRKCTASVIVSVIPETRPWADICCGVPHLLTARTPCLLSQCSCPKGSLEPSPAPVLTLTSKCSSSKNMKLGLARWLRKRYLPPSLMFSWVRHDRRRKPAPTILQVVFWSAHTSHGMYVHLCTHTH